MRDWRRLQDCGCVKVGLTKVFEHRLHVHFAELRVTTRVEQLQQLSGRQGADMLGVLQLEQTAEGCDVLDCQQMSLKEDQFRDTRGRREQNEKRAMSSVLWAYSISVRGEAN